MDLYVWTVLLVPMTKYPCDAAGEGCASEPVTDDLAEIEQRSLVAHHLLLMILDQKIISNGLYKYFRTNLSTIERQCEGSCILLKA